LPVAFFMAISGGIEHPAEKVGVRNACGISQGNLLLQTCLQR